ncbi:hypothetical protein [Novosphingobium sp.]|uniref:hypothetical protein n=1 Tax=Novosphingobium sp. TaxID=1874826 RepID=UPI0038B7DFE4
MPLRMEMGFDDSQPVEAAETAGRLRPLGWRELCARLAAAQDLRREGLFAADATLAGAPGRTSVQTFGTGGSFHHPAAMLLLGTGGSRPVSDLSAGITSHKARKNEERVNPASSVNGKYANGKTDDMQRPVASAPRPEQSRRELP